MMFSNLDPDSKVWIFQSTAKLNSKEDFFLKNMRGVKPFNKNKKNTIDKKKEKKIINTDNYKNKTTTTKTIPKTPNNKKKTPKKNLNLSFGEKNKDLNVLLKELFLGESY